MNKSNLQYELQKEQMARVVAALEGMFVSVFAVITALLLPQLIFQLLLSQGATNLNNATWISYIPTISYIVAAVYFLMAMVGNYLRSRRVREMSKDLELMNYTSTTDVEIESEALAAALAESQEEKSKKKTSSTSKKKSSRKKTTSRSSSKAASSKSSKKKSSSKK